MGPGGHKGPGGRPHWGMGPHPNGPHHFEEEEEMEWSEDSSDSQDSEDWSEDPAEGDDDDWEISEVFDGEKNGMVEGADLEAATPAIAREDYVILDESP